MRDIVRTAFDQAAAILKERRDILDRGARELLAHETLAEGELQELLKPGLVAAETANAVKPSELGRHYPTKLYELGCGPFKVS